MDRTANTCLKNKIELLREQLNILIEQDSDYEEILELSTKLDELINKFRG